MLLGEAQRAQSLLILVLIIGHDESMTLQCVTIST